MRHDDIDAAPRTAVVVGAGILGLSTAWFLQERGVHVTVVDREGVAAGASWGNAGWLSPGLAFPLNDPHILAEAVRSLTKPHAPPAIPKVPDPGLWAFLLRFATHCTMPRWRVALEAYLPLVAQSLEAYDALATPSPDDGPVETPVVAAFARPRPARALLRELEILHRVGHDTSFTELTGDQVRRLRPHVSPRATIGVRLDRQRFVDPGGFLNRLARSLVSRGATIRPGFAVHEMRPRRGGGHTVRPVDGPSISADVVVVATGARLEDLRPVLGNRMPVRAGRGYSFTVPTDEPVPGPVYLPEARVACTPYRDRLRVAGTMEFRPVDAPLDPKRIAAVVAAARPMLSGVRWDERSDPWVGARPITPDALPLIGATARPGVYVAGGHGMWGLTLGPITGRLLTEQITTGKQPHELRPFDPLR